MNANNPSLTNPPTPRQVASTDPADEQHVLLWSQSQCAVHIETTASMLKANTRAYADDRRMDYVPLFFGTSDACHSLSRSLRNTMASRQEDRRDLKAWKAIL